MTLVEQTEAMIRREFPRRVNGEIVRAGITAAELARRCEMPESSIWPIVNAKYVPNGVTVAKIAMELGVSVDYILGISDDRGDAA